MKISIAITLLAFPIVGFADDADKESLYSRGGAFVIHAASHHSGNYNTWNERNPGLGLRINADGYFLAGGGYLNSINNTSLYIGAGKTLYSVGPVRLDVVGLLVTGYALPVTPAITPEIVVSLGKAFFTITIIPPVKSGDISTPAVAGFSFGAKF